MIAIIDYDAGNLKSVEKALKSLNQEVIVSRDSSEILQADKVGAFGDAMNNLDKFGLVDTIKEVTRKNTPFLGICLGLQLLFDKSDETPGAEGLGILKGEILRIPPKEGLKIVAASTEYSTHIHASVESGNVFACQFHPEKSSDIGLQILKNFSEL